MWWLVGVVAVVVAVATYLTWIAARGRLEGEHGAGTTQPAGGQQQRLP